MSEVNFFIMIVYSISVQCSILMSSMSSCPFACIEPSVKVC